MKRTTSGTTPQPRLPPSLSQKEPQSRVLRAFKKWSEDQSHQYVSHNHIHQTHQWSFSNALHIYARDWQDRLGKTEHRWSDFAARGAKKDSVNAFMGDFRSPNQSVRTPNTT